MKAIALSLTFFLVLFISCRKDSFITSSDARISITIDTLKYDTVFTTTGSVTKSFKIINENNQKLKLTSVKLMGGATSAYKMNVDGLAITEANNIEIEANDSVYVFVQVNVDPGSANLPFIIRDSIEVSFNGNKRMVQLEAWGQNAHFLRNKEITTDEIWTNDLPYVILGYLYVHENRKLTIEKGCRIYVHATAPFIVEGTLEVNGSQDSTDRVYFNGDRLDEPYKDFPASWPGIYFSPASKDNIFNYAVIKNAYQSIAVEGPSLNANPKVTLNQCIIDNSYDAGIVSVNSSIKAVNSLISNCGMNIAVIKGGNYDFTHCTVVSYSNSYIPHKSPVLTVTNYDGANNTADLNAVFRNCIFWGENGTVDNEVVIDKKGSNPFTVNFDHNLWKVKTAPANIISNQIISNQSPQFDSINVPNRYYNFRLRDTSPGQNAGTNTGITIDLDGNMRPVGLPDLGCFEKQ
jgi:hypothetical protein